MPAIDINALPISDLMEIIGEKLSDPRQAIGKRFRLDSVVTLIILGHLCGFPCIAHISEWAPKLSHKIRKKLKFGGLKVPSHTTLHRVSKMVDVNQFLDAAREFQSQKSGGLAGVGIAIDGKTIRGAKDNTGKAPHVLSAVRHDNRLPVAQITVPEKANEITALQPMIEKIELTGAMLTIDAMHTNNKTAEYITEVKQADYMLTLKDNQPTLLADVKRLFSEGAFSPLSHTEPATKAHGRIEYRHITVIPLEDGDTYLSNAEQVIKIERIREGVKTKTKTIEVAYCITSAEPEKYTPQQLLKFNRNHWGVEATHHIRDTTFQEDRSTKKLGAVFMAALRAFAIGLLNFLGFPDIARTARALRYAAIT